MSENGTNVAPAGADRAAELEAQLREAQASLGQAREALDASERRRAIEREVAREGAIDVEAAALLTEAAVAGMEGADLRAAVAELRRTKPFLFRAPAPAVRSGAMAGAADEPAPALDDAATAARESGDRRLLLRYLRMKRGQ
ncbi:MAG: hypothetical protein WD749_06290 [Phycisphaerales bacterium]